MMTVPHYQLSSVLIGHLQDVRALIPLGESHLVSASRDAKVIVWERSGTDYVPCGTFSGHSHFVNALAIIQDPPLVVSSGSDKIIYVFDPFHPEEAVYTLLGHADNVCALAVFGETILSGSWDKTAKVWRGGQEVFSLTGHEAAVWGVLAIDADTFVTSSADKTIKVWKGNKCVSTIRGHTDVVRALVPVPGIGFASCSNDACIKVWTLSGEQVLELNGHASFIYSISRLATGELVSGSEDRTCRVWLDDKLVQTLTMPCTSVWTVTGLPNGDFAAGGSDGVIRVFTRDPSRIASADSIKNFEAAVASSAIPSNQVGDIDKTKLPGLDSLSQMGKKEGEVKMVRVGQIVEAYQWSMTQTQWIKIGEVTDAVGQTRKQVYQGKEYDYVFDVDIQEGVPPLKLPYNATDNPFQAAQEFIHKNELPQDYLEQIANFITTNSQSTTIGTTTAHSNPDPYTGTAAQAEISGSKIPMKVFSYFKEANIKAILTKYVQFNSELSSLNHDAHKVKRVQDIANMIEKNPGSFTAVDNVLLSEIAFTWPENTRFPGLDLLRLVVLENSLPLADPMFFDRLFATMSSNQINAMMGFRLLANSFGKGTQHVFSHRDAILQKVSLHLAVPGKSPFRVALATVLLNYAVLMTQQPDKVFASSLCKAIGGAIDCETDAEAAFRLVVALGTLLNTFKQVASGINIQLQKIAPLVSSRLEFKAVSSLFQK